MILYKYVSFDAGIKILENNTIGFTCLNDFNDPFESTAFGFKDREGFLTKPTQNHAFRNNFSKKYACLSLTINPLNPIMWAHYGASHTGLVIGFDVEEAGFNDDGFIIKANQGKMEYFEQEPESNYTPTEHDLLNIGNDEYYSLNESKGHLLKRAFLHKQSCWEYEKEVRIVKNLKSSYLISNAGKTYSNKKVINSKQEWSCITHDFRPLYLYHLSPLAIKEVYLGEKTYRQLRRIDDDYNENNNSMNFQRNIYSQFLGYCRNRRIVVKRAQVNYKNWCLVERVIE